MILSRLLSHSIQADQLQNKILFFSLNWRTLEMNNLQLQDHSAFLFLKNIPLTTLSSCIILLF